MALDKDAILEALYKFRDQIVIVILIGLAAYGAYAVWDDYSRTPEEILNDALPPPRADGPKDDPVDRAKDTVDGLLNRPPVAVVIGRKNPFGTPEQQLRLRQELEAAYQSALEEFRNKNYQAAIDILEKEVIRRDVTETRINYAVSPSEMIRQCHFALTRANMDEVVSRADQAYQAGNAALSSNQRQDALRQLRDALTDYNRVIEVDPQGSELGEEKLKTINQRVTELSEKVLKLQRDILSQSIEQARQQLASARSGSDPIALITAIGRVRAAANELVTIDSDLSIFSQSERDAINENLQAAQKEAAASLPAAIAAVRASLIDTPIEQQALEDVGRNLLVLFETLHLVKVNQDTESGPAAVAVISDYVDALASAMQDLEKKLDSALKNEEFDIFETGNQAKLMEIAQAVLQSGLPIQTGKRNQLADSRASLEALQPPPALDSDYELVSFTKRRNYYNITMHNKQSDKTETLPPLQLDKKHSSGFKLLEVDTDQGIIILSKSPGYRPSRFAIPQG